MNHHIADLQILYPIRTEIEQHIAATSLEMAIIDSGDARGRITPEEVKLIMDELIAMLDNSVLVIGKAPHFTNWTHDDGNLKITCEDSASLEWLECSVYQLPNNEDCHFKVVPADQIPKLIELSIIIPNENASEMEKVKMRMIAQNTHLHVHDWLMIKKEEIGKDLFVVFGVPEVDDDVISKQNGRIFYLFGTCKLHVPSSIQPNPIQSSLCKTEVITFTSDVL